MRFTRGLLAGIGAATSLVLAGSLALLAVSTVIAFKGWPELRAAEAPTETATLAVAAAPKADGPDRAVKLAAPPRPAGRAERSRRSRADATTERAGLGSQVPASTKRTTRTRFPVTDTRPPASTDGADTPRAQPDPAPRPSDGVRDTTQPLADGVREVTDDLGDSLAPASPGLDQTVDGLGETVGTTVEGLGDAVGNVVDGLLGRGPR